ncbi:MAG: CehA/McbA family metallohydrolase, partial [bacterium]
IRDAASGDLISGKLVFLQNGEAIDLGVESFGAIAARKNTIYTATGKGTVRIPAGNFAVWAGRGMEYSADVQSVRMAADSTTYLKAQIKRVVDTSGFIAGDMHLHNQTHSGHGDANPKERIISCLGEGLEWIAATDHFHDTDYTPVAQALGIAGKIATTTGNEISATAYHVNAYPLANRLEKAKEAATDLDKLFELLRKESPAAVIQLNHPRSASAGYFTTKKLDPYWGAFEDSSAVPPFDALEVLNGNRGMGWTAERKSPASVKQDWYNLLNSGHRITAGGNSDSHTVLKTLAGMPRNYIASSTDDPARISEIELAQSIKLQRVSVSRGIYLQFSAGDSAGMGEQVTARNGRVDLYVRVQAPKWIDCDTVQIIGNGQVINTFVVEKTNRTERFRRTITVRPKRDTWYIAIAKGSKSMAPLIHDDDGAPVTPLGFTNPIWIDADGDNKFTSLREYAWKLFYRYKDHPDSLISALRCEPAMPNFAIKLISNETPREQITFFQRLIKYANATTRFLIYRQLGLLNHDESKEVLKEATRANQGPLENIAIRLALMGGKKIGQQAPNTGLTRKELEYLLSIFLNYRHGTKLREWYVYGLTGKEQFRLKDIIGTGDKSELRTRDHRWRRYYPPEDGIIDVKRIFKNSEISRACVLTKLYSQYSGEMPCLLSSASGLTIYANGHLVLQKKSGGRELATFSLPVGKGENQILVSIEDDAGAFEYIFEPIDTRSWINPEMAEKRVHKHIAFGKKTRLRYTHLAEFAGVEDALTDGLLASNNHKDGFWQGFEKDDLDAVIDLGRTQKINKISTGFLQAPGASIFLPKSVEYAISTDGSSFREIAKIAHDEAISGHEQSVYDFVLVLNSITAKYVRVRAENIRYDPFIDKKFREQFPARLFVDEIVVE